MRNIGVIMTAVTLDVFQALFMLGMSAIALGGTTAASFIPVVGTAAASIVSVIGEIGAAAVDTALSMTLGSGFIVLLFFTGLMSWKDFFSFKKMPFILVEYLPFFNSLPGYTALAVRCIMEQQAREMQKQGLAAIVEGPSSQIEEEYEAAQMQEQAQQQYEAPPQPPNGAGAAPRNRMPITDIRPRAGAPRATGQTDGTLSRTASYGAAA